MPTILFKPKQFWRTGKIVLNPIIIKSQRPLGGGQNLIKRDAEVTEGLFICNIDIIGNKLNMINNSKGMVSPVRKYKVVLLGDQAVGKSSIINRFIYDIFDGDHVAVFLSSGQPSASTSLPRTFFCSRKPSDSSSGILPASRDLGPSSPATSEMLQSQSLSMMSPTVPLLTASRSGLTMSVPTIAIKL